MDSGESTTGRTATTDGAALTLMMIAWSAGPESTLAAMRDHTTLSEDSYRREVLCLRAFTPYAAFHTNSTDSTVQISLREAGDSFYRLLASDSVQTASQRQIARLNTFLNTMRADDPERYRLLAEIRLIAPALSELQAHVDSYWTAYRWWAHSPEKNHVGARFCAYCGSESEELQVAAENEFRSLSRAMNRYFERTSVRLPSEG